MKRNTWNNREVVLGVTGSIAAYKACELASRMTELGAKVIPVLTHSAAELVGPSTFEAITGQRAVTAMFDSLQNPDVEHITVASRASLFLIAPATANILAKAANGLADDWLSTTLLVTRAPILFAPAMNTNMYAHPATQANLNTLRARGCHFVGPESGRLACRTVGPGRLIDPPVILEAASLLLDERDDLADKRVLITSGATREALDPVRYLSNRSSGKMGYALALEAMARGAQVTVITGPTEIAPPHGAERIDIETAEEMAEAVAQRLPETDVFVAAAAVADYRPAHAPSVKQKRTGQPLQLELVENPDVLGRACSQRKHGQILVGFAAETGDLEEMGREKLRNKPVDLLVVNRVGPGQCGFGAGSLDALLLDGSATVTDLGHVGKETVAQAVFDRVAQSLRGRAPTETHI